MWRNARSLYRKLRMVNKLFKACRIHVHGYFKEDRIQKGTFQLLGLARNFLGGREGVI